MVSFTTSAIIFTAVTCTMIQGSTAAVPYLISKVLKRGETSLWERDDTLKSELTTCLGSITSANKPTLTWGSANSVDISGLPQTCISELNEINAKPEIAQIEAKLGATEIVNGNSIHVTNMSPQVVSWIKTMEQKLS